MKDEGFERMPSLIAYPSSFEDAAKNVTDPKESVFMNSGIALLRVNTVVVFLTAVLIAAPVRAQQDGTILKADRPEWHCRRQPFPCYVFTVSRVLLAVDRAAVSSAGSDAADVFGGVLKR